MSLASPAAARSARTIPTPRSVFANFRWFVASILTMAMGAQIQGVVVAWQMYAVTHDPLALGMVGLAEAAPFIGFALYAGHVADVRDRRRVALVALVLLFALRRRRWPSRARCSSRRGRGRPGALIQRRHLRGHRRLRRGAQLSAAGAQRAGRRAGAARRCSRARSPGAPGIWQVAAVTGPALGGLLYAWVGADARRTRSPRR